MESPQTDPVVPVVVPAEVLPIPMVPWWQRYWYWLLIAGMIVVLGVVLMALGGTTEPVTPAQSEPFVIGAIVSLTGDAASFGIPIRQAADLAVKELNETGGIAGRPVEIRWEDGKCEPEDARAGAERLLAAGDLSVFLAGGCSGEFLAAAPLAQAKNVISISSSATNPDISKLGKMVFRSVPSDALAGQVAAEYALTKFNAQSAAIIAEDKSYTLGLRKVFTENFTNGGGTIVSDAVFQTGTIDFSTIAAQIAAANPSVVYLLPQTPTPGILAVKALTDAGFTGKIPPAEVLLIRDAIEEQGAVLEGVTGIEVYFDEQNPNAIDFMHRFEETYALEAAYPVFMTGIYDLLYLIAEAAEATDGSTIAIANYLYEIPEWDGALGKLSFTPSGDALLPFAIRTINNREAPIVDTYTVSE